MSINFENDLKKLYKIVGKRQKELGELYDVLETGENFDKALQNSFEELFLELELSVTAQNKLALISRLVSLRDEQLVQVLSSEGNSAKEIEKKKRIAYFWVRNFYLKRHEELLKVIESEELLNPFYRRLLQGVHEVGVVLSSWQDDWNEHIINTINPKLKELYGENVMSFLQTNELLEKDESGDIADRAYSVLEYRDNTFTPQPYAIFFAEDVKNVVSALEKLIKDLSSMADEETNQKDEYIEYFKALSLAFKEKDSSLLIKRWADVDRAWMQVKSPIQVGHPLEYYEDHYRKAVALEWDIRLSNPQSLGADTTYDNILSMYKAIFNQVGKEFADVYELNSLQV